MRIGRCIGPDQKLLGREALIRPDPHASLHKSEPFVMAQFNFPESENGKKPWLRPEEFPECYGWHLHEISHFKKVTE